MGITRTVYDRIRHEATHLARATATRAKAVAKAFAKPHLIEEPRTASIVFAHDWGADGAQANVEYVIKTIARARNRRVDLTTIPGIPALASPLIAAIEFDRVIDTHKITLEALVRLLEEEGHSLPAIHSALPPLVLLNVFDRGVGSERIPAIAEGTITINGYENSYPVPITLIGPANNGIIGSLVRRLENVRAFDLSNSVYYLSALGCVTWDGRKIFGPVAAYHASGVQIHEFGSEIDLTAQPVICYKPQQGNGVILAPLVDIDAIGNLVVGLRNGDVETLLGAPYVHIRVQDGKTLDTYAHTGSKFSDVPRNCPVAYRGSNGLLELAINSGSIAAALGLSKKHGDLDLVADGLELRPKTHLVLRQVSEQEARAVA